MSKLLTSSSMMPVNRVTALVLGIMQDAGLPHVGCGCARCAAAFAANPSQAQFAASMALIDTRGEQPGVWLIDATPDIKHQINLLSSVLGAHVSMPHRLRQPDGLFLTHAHMGHTAGLAQLGPEGMNVRNLPLYASAGLLDVLRSTRLWYPLIANLNLVPLQAGRPFFLSGDLSLTPILVPHRDELKAGTFAFRIQGPQRSLLYVPDIDDWRQWNEAREFLAGVDVALVDGSFFSRDELGGRAPVAHPIIPETLEFCAGLPCRLVLTHLNHTNPVVDAGSEARQVVESAGVEVAFTGQQFRL